MHRPLYETDADRTREAAVVDEFARAHRLVPVKLGGKYPADFGLMQGERLVGVAEVKVRFRRNPGMYPEMAVSLAKCQQLRGLAAWGLKVRLLFAMREGIFVQPITCDISVGPKGAVEMVGDGFGGGYIGMMGRSDRGDAHDIEAAVFFETKRMKRVCDAPAGMFEETT